MGMGDGCLIKYIEMIESAVSELSDFHGQIAGSAPLIAYRGESHNHGRTKLMPSIFREKDYVKKESHLFELFSDHDIVNRNASNIEKAIEAQHYASISRMLDITFDALIALDFACASHKKKNGKEDIEEDGVVFVFAFPRYYSPHSDYIEDFYTNILKGNHIAYSRNFKVFSHSYANDRIRAQKGGFIFFPGSEFYPIDDCYYREIPIDGGDKESILHDLDRLFQINEATLFPEKDKIAKAVKERFEKSAYSAGKVSIEAEAEEAIRRIDHELQIRDRDDEVLDDQGRKERLRRLRKEERDLTDYVNEQELERYGDTDGPKVSVEELLEQIKRDFEILRMPYKVMKNEK